MQLKVHFTIMLHITTHSTTDGTSTVNKSCEIQWSFILEFMPC